MNKDQNENATTQTQEEFDRSICMSFFGNYRTSVKRIEKKYGVNTAYQVQSAIIDYGLYGIRPTDEDILIFVSETVFDVIDKSQAKRARSFSGEDLEMSKKIIQSHRDRPDLSQDKLAQLLHTSKGKVNKTLKKYRNGEYDGILNFDDNDNDNVNDSDYDNDVDNDSTDRDRPTNQSTESASPITEAKLPAQQTPTELTWKEYNSVIDMWEDNKTKDKRNRKNPNDIADGLNLDRGLVNQAIDEYKANNYKRKEKSEEFKQFDIPLTDGTYYWLTKQELFNRITDNGKTKVDDIDWDCFESDWILSSIAPSDAKLLIKEFKQKLQDKNDMSVLKNVANM